MMTVTGLCAGYEAGDVLHGVDITAGAGELTVILGANGSGKSTLFRTISGVLRPSGGRIEFEGEDCTRSTTAAMVRKGLAHCPEGRHLFPRMSVEKNLLLGAYVGRRDKDRVQTLLEAPEGAVNWTDKTFERLQNAQPEALTRWVSVRPSSCARATTWSKSCRLPNIGSTSQ